MRSPRFLALPLIAALILGASACSSETSGGALPDCPTAATMKAELGVDVKEPTVTGSDPVRSCMYSAAEGKISNAVVRFQGKHDAAQFAATKAGFDSIGQTTTAVTGLGDEAFSTVITAGNISNNSIVARKGALQILVTSTATLDQEKAFIAKLFG